MAVRHPRGLCSIWWAALQNEHGNILQLFDMLSVASLHSRNRRKQLLVQLVRVVGGRIDDLLVGLTVGHADLPLVKYQAINRVDDGNVDRFTSTYWQAGGDMVTSASQFLSMAPDKSRVGSVGMMLSPVCKPGNKFAWACPQDLEQKYGAITRIA